MSADSALAMLLASVAEFRRAMTPGARWRAARAVFRHAIELDIRAGDEHERHDVRRRALRIVNEQSANGGAS